VSSGLNGQTPGANRAKLRVAVLGLQGDFQKHIDRLNALGADAYNARVPDDISSADALVLPGGESTTIGKLLIRYQLVDSIKDAAAHGKPIFGTCAGLIVLAAGIADGTGERGGQTTLGLLNVVVSRNAFGRQIDSFECELDAPSIIKPGDEPLSAVFIRAPIVEEIRNGVEVIASYEGQIVFVRQGNILGASFHPELTDDTRVHAYFLDIVRKHAERVIA
jgi:5'-phosphate synthase pdxT subunit